MKFNKLQYLHQHFKALKPCTKVKFAYSGGIYNNALNVFQQLELAGIHIPNSMFTHITLLMILKHLRKKTPLAQILKKSKNREFQLMVFMLKVVIYIILMVVIGMVITAI